MDFFPIEGMIGLIHVTRYYFRKTKK